MIDSTTDRRGPRCYWSCSFGGAKPTSLLLPDGSSQFKTVQRSHHGRVCGTAPILFFMSNGHVKDLIIPARKRFFRLLVRPEKTILHLRPLRTNKVRMANPYGRPHAFAND